MVSFFFHIIFQTIQIYPPLVVGRFQRKRSIYPEIPNIIEISVYTVKNHCVIISQEKNSKFKFLRKSFKYSNQLHSLKFNMRVKWGKFRTKMTGRKLPAPQNVPLNLNRVSKFSLYNPQTAVMKHKVNTEDRSHETY